MSSCPNAGTSACATCPSRASCPSAQQQEKKPSGCSGNCEGCPMRDQCGHGGPMQDPDLVDIQDRMLGVKHKIIVLSGKGGVGKSTVSAQLAFYLASKGHQVGLLDLDICGPSIPHMLNIESETIHASTSGWSPVYVRDNLAVMSIGFLLPSRNEAVVWRGPRKNGLIKQFLKDVDWGNLDFLIMDTPPGTSDEHISTVQFLKDTGIDGAVIVSTPQEVALLDVRKEITFCKKIGLKVVGVVENMSGFVCPHCQTETHVFRPSTGGAQAMCTEMECPYLGRIPLDPLLAQAAEDGVQALTDSLAIRPLQNTFDLLMASVITPAAPAAEDKPE